MFLRLPLCCLLAREALQRRAGRALCLVSVTLWRRICPLQPALPALNSAGFAGDNDDEDDEAVEVPERSFSCGLTQASCSSLCVGRRRTDHLPVVSLCLRLASGRLRLTPGTATALSAMSHEFEKFDFHSPWTSKSRVPTHTDQQPH